MDDPNEQLQKTNAGCQFLKLQRFLVYFYEVYKLDN